MDEKRVDEIFERISEMEVELDDDPIRRGPKFLNNQVAECRNYVNEVQKYMRECQKYIRVLERDLRTKEASYEIEYNHIMATDEDIQAMRSLSKSDRESLAQSKLRDEIEEINKLELELTDARHVETVLDSKLRELRDVNRDIRLQKRLIEDEIDTGSFWGNDHGEYDAEEIGPDEVEFDGSADDVAPAPAEDVFEDPPEDSEDEFEHYFDFEEMDNSDGTSNASIDAAPDSSGDSEKRDQEGGVEVDFESAAENLG